jgi:hypothetical protein
MLPVLKSKNVEIKIHQTVILLLFYGYETWSPPCGQDTELSESRVLRRWFECERQEVTGEWIKLYSELYDLYAMKYHFSWRNSPDWA